MNGAAKLRAGALGVLLCAVIAGGFVVQAMNRPERSKYCTASLPFREIDGRTVAVQDKAGGTECDLDETRTDMATLGTDCKVRAPDGTVLDTLKSSRNDSTLRIRQSSLTPRSGAHVDVAEGPVHRLRRVQVISVPSGR